MPKGHVVCEGEQNAFPIEFLIFGDILRQLDREEKNAGFDPVGQDNRLHDGFVPRAGGFGANVECKFKSRQRNAACTIAGLHGVRRDQVVQSKSGEPAGTSTERLFRNEIPVQDHSVPPADDHTVRQVSVYSIKTPGSEADLSVFRLFPCHGFRVSSN